jgi:cytochrome b561
MSVSVSPTAVDRSLTKSQRFDDVAICLHWVTLALVIAQFTSAWVLSATAGDQATALLRLHRSLGVAIWFVTVGRFAWRKLFSNLPPFPESMPKFQQGLAKLNEYGLYALLIIQPLTGIASTIFLGRPFPLFLWQMPTILARDRGIAHFFAEMHQIGAYTLLSLIGVHALAALFHRLVLRDNVLQRMLPTATPRSQQRSGGG